jgi:uncharacterized membrane protein YkoI
MKKTTLCIIAMSGFLFVNSPAARAERVSYRELPDQVKKTLKKDRDDIKRIETFDHNGQKVYEVQMEKKGPNQFVYIDPDGTRLNDPSLRNQRLADTKNLKLNDLPKPVQKTFKDRAGSARISSVDIDAENGKTVYNIAYTRKGRADSIRINEDGSIARADRETRRQERVSQNEGATAVGFDRPLASTQKVDFENVPEAVKKTVRDVAGENRIEDAERGTLDGQTVYEIAFKKDGKHNELRVAEDGSIVQRIAGSNVRFPGAMTVNEVPAPVRRAIKDEVGSGEVNDIDKKTVDGKTVYEVGFKKESGGAQHEIQIAEDGTILGEPAGAENK